MSGSWSWFVIALVVLNIAGCVALLWWTARKRPGAADASAPPQTSHVWDGDITEYDKPLPRWWINLFYLTILFTIVYLVVFPGFGRFAGTSGWSSVREHAADKAATEQRLRITRQMPIAPPAMARWRAAPSAIPTSPTTSGSGVAAPPTSCRRCCMGAPRSCPPGARHCAPRAAGMPPMMSPSTCCRRAIRKWRGSMATPRRVAQSCSPVSAPPVMALMQKATPYWVRLISPTGTGCTAAAAPPSALALIRDAMAPCRRMSR